MRLKYSLFLCPEDFSTQNQMDIGKKHLSKSVSEFRGVLCRRKALLTEESHVPLHPEQRRQWMAGCHLSDHPLAHPVEHLPPSWPGCIHPEHWHCLQSRSTAKQRAFFYKRPLTWKKESGREQLQQVRAESRGAERILGLFQVLT